MMGDTNNRDTTSTSPKHNEHGWRPKPRGHRLTNSPIVCMSGQNGVAYILFDQRGSGAKHPKEEAIPVVVESPHNENPIS